MKNGMFLRHAVWASFWEGLGRLLEPKIQDFRICFASKTQSKFDCVSKSKKNAKKRGQDHPKQFLGVGLAVRADPGGRIKDGGSRQLGPESWALLLK